MNKQTIQFDMELFRGYTCIGCAVINDLAFEVEFTDKEIAKMKQDFGIGDDEEIDDNRYYEWYDEEMDRIRCSGLAWIRSRYSVDNQVSMEYTPYYTVDIPSDFLPE